MTGNPNAKHAFAAFEGNPDFLLSLARGLRVIECFEWHADGLTVAQVAAYTGLSRAAARRSLITLELLGYAAHTGRVYRLGTRTLQLGFSYLSSNSLPTLAQPILEQVTATLHESSSLSVLEHDEIVYLARSATNRVMSVGLSVGSRLPAYCSSMGRVLLAALPEEQFAAYLDRVELKPLTPKTITDKAVFTGVIERARAQGFVMVNEELEVGLRSLAVPVRTRSNRIVAAINSGVHAARVPAKDMIQRLLPVLREGASKLGQLIT